MELAPVIYDAADVVVTSFGNKISRKCSVFGSQNIVLSGNDILMKDCIIRGDLACVRMGRYCHVGERTIVRPPYKHFSKGLTFFPIHIGDHVFIEHDCVVVAIFIGSCVHIGANAIVGQSSVIKDCCYIQPNSVVMPDTIIPPFSVVGGNPAKVIGEWLPTSLKLMQEMTTNFYENYIPKEPKQRLQKI